MFTRNVCMLSRAFFLSRNPGHWSIHCWTTWLGQYQEFSFPLSVPQLGGWIFSSEGLEPVISRPATYISRVPRPFLLLLSQKGQAFSDTQLCLHIKEMGTESQKKASKNQGNKFFLIILDPFVHYPVEKTLQKNCFLIWHFGYIM